MPKPDMTEFEEIARAGEKRPQKPCPIADYLRQHSEDAEALERAIRDHRPGTIVRWFERRGTKIHTTPIINHRERSCACKLT